MNVASFSLLSMMCREGRGGGKERRGGGERGANHWKILPVYVGCRICGIIGQPLK